MIAGFAAGVLFGSGTYFQSLAGALLLQLWLILDCVDGEVARYRGTTGICGKYVDTLNHGITEPFVFLCIGFGLCVLFDNISIFVLGVLVALFVVWSSYSANLVYEIFVTGMHDMGDVVSRYRSCMIDTSAANKISTIRRIYNFCIKNPFSFSWYTVMFLIVTILDMLFIAFCPDVVMGGLTIAFGPGIDIVHLDGIDHKLRFNFLYIYFIFFSIVSITRSIVRMHNNFQGVCRYQRDAKQQQS